MVADQFAVLKLRRYRKEWDYIVCVAEKGLARNPLIAQ
jgi:hypothetical protein